MEAIDPSRRATEGKGHLLTLVGFALLCISFLLPFPAIYAPTTVDTRGGTSTVCYFSDIPTQQRAGMSPAAVAFGEGHAVRYFLGPGFPFILGAAGLCIYLLRRLRRAPRIVFGILLVWAAGVICALLIRAISTLMALAHEAGAMDSAIPTANTLDAALPVALLAALILIAGFGCAAVIFARRDIRRPLGAVCCGLISLPVFVLHILDMTRAFYVGPFVSALACVLILIGGIREALVAARAPRHRLAFRR